MREIPKQTSLDIKNTLFRNVMTTTRYMRLRYRKSRWLVIDNAVCTELMYLKFGGYVIT